MSDNIAQIAFVLTLVSLGLTAVGVVVWAARLGMLALGMKWAKRALEGPVSHATQGATSATGCQECMSPT